MKNNQLKGLEEATKARSEECVRLANAAIDALKEKGEKITYVSVAKASGVSRTTLYHTDIIRERIESLKALGKRDNDAVKRVVVKEGMDRERQLREEISKLKKEKQKLIIQLLDQKELLEENIKLRTMVERLQAQLRS